MSSTSGSLIYLGFVLWAAAGLTLKLAACRRGPSPTS